MKKTVIRLLLTSLLAFVLPSCKDDDAIWDIAPMCFRIELKDKAGVSVDLDTKPGREIYDKVTIEYNDETFKPHNRIYTTDATSRAIPAIFNGLFYERMYNVDDIPRMCLYFGEFSREKNYTLYFKVNWPDGTSDEVKFKNKISWRFGEPHIKSQTWVDGKKLDNYAVISHRLND